MTAHIPDRHFSTARERPDPDACVIIGLLLGMVMPFVAAMVYPTYVHKMPDPVVEWTRLQEIPFVIAEALVIGWALFRGMKLRPLVQLVPKDCLVAGGLLMVGLWVSTSLVSKGPGTSAAISASTIVHVAFGFSLFYLLDKGGAKMVDRLALGLGWGLVALAILTAGRFLQPPPAWLIPGGNIEWPSALPGFINVRHFGSWTGAITAILAALILNRRNETAFSWHDIFFLLAMAMTIWSGTRAAVLAIAASCAIMVASRGHFPSLRVIFRLVILTGIAACLAYLLVPYNHTTFMLFHANDGVASADAFTSGRISMWAATYSKWLEAPWFGWGSGSTFWEVYVGWTHTQPHNFVLQFLISWGLVGACGAFWLLGRVTVAVHRRALVQPAAWPLNAGLYALLVMALLEGMLHYPRFIMLIMALYAIIFRITEADAETGGAGSSLTNSGSPA